jgi:hypothetical protein
LLTDARSGTTSGKSLVGLANRDCAADVRFVGSLAEYKPAIRGEGTEMSIGTRGVLKLRVVLKPKSFAGLPGHVLYSAA